MTDAEKRLETQHGIIVLLCWERTTTYCHRFLLKDILDAMQVPT